MGTTYPNNYECICSGELGLNLQINCSLQYSDGGEVFVNEEKIIFYRVQMPGGGGIYQLAETSWNDSSFGSFEPQEVFSLNDGALSSCEASGCSSCTICPDKLSIEVDCGGLQGGLEYTFECGDGYTGSFLNTFDFGVITEEFDAVDEQQQQQAAKGPVSREEFCKDMGKLETHLTNSFEAFMGTTYPNNYECICSGELGLNLQINCSLQYSDGGEVFVNEEKIIFYRVQMPGGGGIYQLAETSWNDSSFGSFEPQEVFSLNDGALSSCEASGCSSCTICPDKLSIEVDCGGLQGGLEYTFECGDGYTGSFLNTFDFGVITEEFDAVESELTNLTEDSESLEDIMETSEDIMGDIGDEVNLDDEEAEVESDLSDMDGISPAVSRSIGVSTVGVILVTSFLT